MERKRKQQTVSERLRTLGTEMIRLADEMDGKKSALADSDTTQALVKAIFELNQRIDDLEDRVNRRYLPFPVAIESTEAGPTEEDNHREEESDENLSARELKIRRRVREALEKHGGNRAQAAAELGMSERSIYRHLPPEYRKRS